MFASFRKPDSKQIAMHLDAKVSDIGPKKEGLAESFDYWLSLATPTRRKRRSFRCWSNNTWQGVIVLSIPKDFLDGSETLACGKINKGNYD